MATTHQPQSLWTCGKPIRLEAANYIYDSITRTDAADETAMITQWILLQKWVSTFSSTNKYDLFLNQLMFKEKSIFGEYVPEKLLFLKKRF